MSETIRQRRSYELSEIYAQLNKEDVEQFYAGYQWWNLQQQAAALQAQIENQHRQINENIELMQLVHPPAIALATIARLQASGVNDIDLLDRMMERGEDWLDRTMQRLDYCEQLDFIDDYTKWCQNALDGAYDWIDSMREANPSSSEVAGADTSIETTEELLLQKLTSEEEETPAAEMSTEQSDQDSNEPSAGEMEVTSENDLPAIQVHDDTTEMEAASESDRLTPQVDLDVDSRPEELLPIGEHDVANVEQLPVQAHSEDSLTTAPPLPTIEESPTYGDKSLPNNEDRSDEQPDLEADHLETMEKGTQVARPERRRSFLQRLASKVWHS